MKEDEFLNIRDLSFFHTMHKPNKNFYLGYRYNISSFTLVTMKEGPKPFR